MSSEENYKIRQEKSLNHLFDGSLLNVYEKNIVNLGVGAPGPDLLENCTSIFENATSHRMAKENENGNFFLFQYGPNDGTFGVRNEIAKYLSDQYKSPVFHEDIVITTGATHGLHLIISTFIDFEGYIFIDEAVYFIAINVFRQFPTLKIIPLRLTNEGIDLDHFEELLKSNKFHSKGKLFWGMYYAIPTYHNPTGITFSDKVCKSLVSLARKYDILIACDDVYNILNYKDPLNPAKRLYSFDTVEDPDYKGHVISNGSFSKIISPGIRMGWIEAPPRCKKPLVDSGLISSGGCTNNYTAGLLESLFTLGSAQTHIKTLYNAYCDRMKATCEVLKENMPEGCSFHEPEGGYFIWIKLPEDKDSNDLLKLAMDKYKIFFLPGNRFSIENKMQNCFRISIAFHPSDLLKQTALKLCQAIQEFLN